MAIRGCNLYLVAGQLSLLDTGRIRRANKMKEKIKRKLMFFSDPGHGWLRINQYDLEDLGITDKISGFSYQRGSRVYLEEDCDAPRYLAAAKAAGWHIDVIESHTDGLSRIRRMDRFTR